MERFPIDVLIDKTTAPMLMIHASNDKTVSPLNSVEIYKALLTNGVKQSSLHIFPLGGHSISLKGTNPELQHLAGNSRGLDARNRRFGEL